MLDINDVGLVDFVLRNIKRDIDICEEYQENYVKLVMKERYDTYYADEEYYKKKFPLLSKKSSLVDTSVADTLEWALPSLVRLFFGAENPVTIVGVQDSDQSNAEVMSSLIDYQISRKNNSFVTFYNWFKDALIGFGVVKCIWERESSLQQKQEVMNYPAYQSFSSNPNIIVSDVEQADMFGNVMVTYMEKIYRKNNPKIENILISEFLFPPRCKSLEESPFVAHKKRVTISHLNQKARDGVYTNVELIRPQDDKMDDDLQLEINDNYDTNSIDSLDKARAEVTLYECYTQLDINDDGILEDLIVTVCQDKILRLELNPFGRHPFFTLSPIRDPHRAFPRRGFPEMIGQLQHLKTALIRQMVVNIGLTNDPRMIMAEDAINIQDYIDGKAIIRKKAGVPMSDAAMPLPIQPLHPWTFQFLEYVESQKEARTGITRYNQGLDGSSLSHTATGISAIINQSNQRLELIARMFSETGIRDLYRFLITLNQKFVDQEVVIRVTDRELKIRPDDLQGDIDLTISAGAGTATREQNMMYLQTFLTSLLQLTQSGMPICTPTNIYNLMKRWIKESGVKNYADYITDPAIVQQRMMLETQMRAQLLSTLPLPLQSEYIQTGTLRPEILMQLPPEVQQILVGDFFGQQTGTNGGSQSASPSGEFGGGSPGISGGLATGTAHQDNRTTKGLPNREVDGNEIVPGMPR